MDPQSGNGLSRNRGRNRWFRDKTNLFLFGVATLSFLGIAVACLGAFALDNAPVAVAGSVMVSVAAVLWIIWTVSVTLQIIFQRSTKQTSNDPSRTGAYHEDNPAGTAP